ncbi:MAG: hypothetical protein V8S95_05855 [Odoribacter sp.]
MTADQRDYVIVTWTKIFNIVKVICQIVALRFLDFGYIVWLGIEFIFGISYGFWINGQVTNISLVEIGLPSWKNGLQGV